ncbi:MAG: DMT family transporter [Chloroflexi bacterium]|nr:DMT family transporter [Chloroflexota bacterium]MBU1751373.1 DMT family transporter [Chloroflexota bacterium]
MTPSSPTRPRALTADALLLLTALIWGLAFTAQRAGMTHVGPFTFNAIRFLLGSALLMPVLLVVRWRRPEPGGARVVLAGGLLAGFLLFLGVSLQQIGLQYTTAGKAGFITGLYVIMVPLLALLWRQRVSTGTWLAAVLAVVGMYFLSGQEQMTVAWGDAVVLAGAVCWAIHVQVIGWLSPRTNALRLAVAQFLVCAGLSLLCAGLLVEPITVAGLLGAGIPILYAGGVAVGVGYTLQVVAQRDAPAAHAAIILSLEAVFAVLGGWLILGETLSLQGVLGCDLMLIGMLLSQRDSAR